MPRVCKDCSTFKIGPKFKKFLDEQGYRYDKIAKRLGFNPRTFYVILHGTRDFPKERYLDIIKFTDGYISVKDIVEDRLKEFEYLQINDNGDQTKCEVIIKEVNATPSIV